jgi:S1-C subfamily serine protease
VIVSFDGRPIFTIDDLQRLLTEERVGVPMTVGVVRGTELVRFDVMPSEAPNL